MSNQQLTSAQYTSDTKYIVKQVPTADIIYNNALSLKLK